MLKCLYNCKDEKYIVIFNDDNTYKLFPSLRYGKWKFKHNVLQFENNSLYYNYNYLFKNIETNTTLYANNNVLEYFNNYKNINNNPINPKVFFISKFINFNN